MTPHPSTPSDPDTCRLRVLLVDDAARVRHELGQLLELTGTVQVVGEAGDGQEAIRLAADLAPDVIVMDLEMPGLDGFEATRRIKARPSAPRVVVLSVHTGDSEQDAREAGADSFVVKGASYQILLNAILGKDGPNHSFGKGEKS